MTYTTRHFIILIPQTVSFVEVSISERKRRDRGGEGRDGDGDHHSGVDSEGPVIIGSGLCGGCGGLGGSSAGPGLSTGGPRDGVTNLEHWVGLIPADEGRATKLVPGGTGIPDSVGRSPIIAPSTIGLINICASCSKIVIVLGAGG